MEVRLCECRKCPLWRFRMGRESTEDARFLRRRMWVKFPPIREDRRHENTGMRRKIRRSQPLLHRSQVVILPERSELRY